MPGLWDRDNNQGHGKIADLPMGGLLSELLASEGVDALEFSEAPSESFAEPAPSVLAVEVAPVESPPPDALPAGFDNASLHGPAIALPGLAAQLWALNQAASADCDDWPSAEAVEPESVVPAPVALAEPPQDPDPVPEVQHFALPGLLLSLTEQVAEFEPEPEPQPEPILASVPEPEAAPEPVAFTSPTAPESLFVTPEILVDIVEDLPEELPFVEVPLPHGRSNDLSNLIGAIDSELATAPDLPPGTAHELDKTHERFVCFRLGGISYGLHMRLVREVEKLGRVTQVPGAPKLVCGLINLRGEILPLLDTRILLELEPASWPPTGYLLVVQPDPEEPPVALLVDELGGVALVDPATVETELGDLEHSMARHTLGLTEHRGRIALLLDHRNLVTSDALMAAAERGSSN